MVGPDRCARSEQHPHARDQHDRIAGSQRSQRELHGKTSEKVIVTYLLRRAITIRIYRAIACGRCRPGMVWSWAVVSRPQVLRSQRSARIAERSATTTQ